MTRTKGVKNEFVERSLTGEQGFSESGERELLARAIRNACQRQTTATMPKNVNINRSDLAFCGRRKKVVGGCSVLFLLESKRG